MNYKRLLFLWLVIVMFSGGARGQVYTDMVVRDFKISNKSTVEVSNKYGKVHVRTWDKDSVRFEVNLRIQTTNTQKLQKLKNQISFDFTSTNYYVVAKTAFTKSGGIFSDVVESIVPSNTVTINYTVYIPKTTTLKIENKFGDVYIDDFKGNLALNLSNGNLKANYLQGNTSIKLNSGDGWVNRVDKGTIEVSYSDFEIKQIGNIEFDTRSSRIEIRKADQIKVYSRRDKYFIDEINNISGDGDFTTINISRLKNEFNANMKYGELTIENIPPVFNLINIISIYTDIDLKFERGANYNLDITHHQDVYLTYPNEIKGLETKELNDANKTMLTYGLVGAKTSVNVPKVKIVAEKKCYLNILHE